MLKYGVQRSVDIFDIVNWVVLGLEGAKRLPRDGGGWVVMIFVVCIAIRYGL